MKRYFLIITLILLPLLLSAQARQKSPKTNPRKKVAVVLSGGGAKGAAHIGVLKVLEQENVPVDMIVGTSMGALMGGLYAIGYSPAMLDSLVRIQDWQFILSDKIDPNNQNQLYRSLNNTYMLNMAINDFGTKFSLAPAGLIKGKNLSNLFSHLTLGYHDSIDFNTLPIPFACVATDITNFNEIVFHSGILSVAMRASMSIPAVFSPVYIDSMVLVDGGLRNNFPVDVAKQMGADIVIGVSVQNDMNKTADDVKNALDVVTQLTDMGNLNKLEENIAQTDVFIKVDVSGFSAASFDKRSIDTLIQRGEDASLKHLEELRKLKKQLGLNSDYVAQRPRPYQLQKNMLRMRISDIHFFNIQNNDKKYLKEKFNLRKGESTTITDLENVLSVLRGDLFYRDASYKIEYRKDGYAINIASEGKKQLQLYIGARFDNEEKVSMQLGALMPVETVVPTVLQATLRLGKRSMGKISATFNTPNFAPLTLAYTFRHNDLDVYHKGNKDFNSDYKLNEADFGIINYGKNKFSFDAFIRWNYYSYKQILVQTRSRKPFVSLSHLYSYHIKINYNQYPIEKILPPSFAFTKGFWQWQISYRLYTDNFYQYENNVPLNEIQFSLLKRFPINNRIYMEPKLYGRSIYGDDIPTILQNAVGGHYFAHYIPQQMAFAGIGNTEVVNNNFVAFEINTSYRLSDNHTVSLTAAMGQSANALRNLPSASTIFGIRASYFYNTIIGPIGAYLGYSTRTNKPYLFINIGYEF